MKKTPEGKTPEAAMKGGMSPPKPPNRRGAPPAFGGDDEDPPKRVETIRITLPPKRTATTVLPKQ